MRGISTDRWTCPDCGETVGRSSLTSQERWEKQLAAMQRRHAERHAASRALRATFP